MHALQFSPQQRRHSFFFVFPFAQHAYSYNVAQNQDSRQSIWIIDSHCRDSRGVRLENFRYARCATMSFQLRSYFCLTSRKEISTLRLFIARTHSLHVTTRKSIITTPLLFSIPNKGHVSPDWKFVEHRYADRMLFRSGDCNRWTLDNLFRTHLLPYRCIMMGIVQKCRIEWRRKGVE